MRNPTLERNAKYIVTDGWGDGDDCELRLFETLEDASAFAMESCLDNNKTMRVARLVRVVKSAPLPERPPPIITDIN